jgi:CheY-like chemotaxis protein
MSFTFFLAEIPSAVTDTTLQSLLSWNTLLSASFVESAAGPVAMVEVRSREAAARFAAKLAVLGLDGSAPILIAPETAEGQHLASLFRARAEEQEDRRLPRSFGCLLVVDDDAVSLQITQAQVAAGLPHACVHSACSGHAALELNKRHEFAAILSHVRLTGPHDVSRIAAIQRIRPHTPIVVMTDQPELLPWLIDSGVFGFMRTPVDPASACLVLARAARYHALSKAMAHAREHVLDSDRGELIRRAAFERLESLKRWLPDSR